ncbi:MAG: alpha-amylase family glycosyl hydrolase [bacterium]|nr:alpha-amylase family glycosyl hydrolase [bacterium]
MYPLKLIINEVLEIKSKSSIKIKKLNSKKIFEFKPIKSLVKIKLDEVGVYEAYNNGVKNYIFVEPIKARFSSWYEIFPRSLGGFKGVINFLPYVKELGFDVLYLTPIHPIGYTNRKGRNNSLVAAPGDPGSPWAVGSHEGGHKSVHPQLGTIEDFRNLVEEAKKLGIDIALDITLMASPDHPYVKQHPDWFYYDEKGKLRHAENPPKKYEDVCPLNFYPKNRQEMWHEMKDIFVFWIKNGVKIFRVDNPHTKPTEFWEWLIFEIKKEYPEVIFLSEAFTFYEKLEELAKIGFTQSYTYFTWRNSKNEMIEYAIKFINPALKNYIRPNFFANTPDILTPTLQHGGEPAFKLRVALAATLSTAYGIYTGYELLENEAFPGKEEYNNNEKYEIKNRDYNKEPNIKWYIKKLNEIRIKNPALQKIDFEILPSTDDAVMAYMKKDKNNLIVFVANFDFSNRRFSRVTLPFLNVFEFKTYKLKELITDRDFYIKGNEFWVMLEKQLPFYIFSVSEEEMPIYPESPEAYKDAEIFFDLRNKVLYNHDFYARKEIEKFYYGVIAPKAFISPLQNESYTYTINKISQEKGFHHIMHAYYTTPGH